MKIHQGDAYVFTAPIDCLVFISLLKHFMPQHPGTVLPEVLPVAVFLHYFALLILKCKICHPHIKEKGIKKTQRCTNMVFLISLACHSES